MREFLILLCVVTLAIFVWASVSGRGHAVLRLQKGSTGLSVQLVMSAAISVIVLASALWVVLFGDYPDATQKWAFGAVGSVVGFWLPAQRD
jgi:hypothetical protein